MFDNPDCGFGIMDTLVNLDNGDTIRYCNFSCSVCHYLITRSCFKETKSHFNLCSKCYSEGKVPAAIKSVECSFKDTLYWFVDVESALMPSQWYRCLSRVQTRDKIVPVQCTGPQLVSLAPTKDASIGRGFPSAIKTHMESQQKVKVNPKKEASNDGSSNAQTFMFGDLAAATKNFRGDCLLGEGGFGRVYRGYLESINQVVAIKQLDRNGSQGNREFLVEVLMLNLLHHPNLVNLLGYCADGDQRLLVYEYMPLGSLEDHLHYLPPDKKGLDWNMRMKIAAGAAKGLEYLHDKASPPVIYRDLKCSNILLGEGYHPKLSDFGLAKLGPVGDNTHVSTRVMGTYGYCAPEYAMTGQLTLKSDVYSFGVARPLFKDRRKFSQMVDPLLQGQYPGRGLYQALAIAAMCVQEQPTMRPLIADVVTALSYLASQIYNPETQPVQSSRVLSTPRSRRDSDKHLNNVFVNRDAYGFALRPQHLQRYREYATIYKEEEEERSEKWKDFLERLAESGQMPVNELSTEGVNNCELDSNGSNGIASVAEDTKTGHKIQIWANIRPSLDLVEHMMRFRVKQRKLLSKNVQTIGSENHLPAILESTPGRGNSEEDSEDVFYDVEKTDPVQDGALVDSQGVYLESTSVSQEELECLVHGGVPMALRGELWQAFVGVRDCRVDTYYQELLASNQNGRYGEKCDNSISETTNCESSTEPGQTSEKWKGQIEKAMNFFAGLLLLLMPEENAFWALLGIMDDYFDGYYSEEMIESQVDQLVFEELVYERFPTLVNHLEYLGVQVAWVTGPWFLSIFVNVLPWETGQVLFCILLQFLLIAHPATDVFVSLAPVLRVWDVLLFEGNRVMLFRTALALMELYGPALNTTKDAGDAVTLMQSLASSTFDSSQLVLTACMGYQAVNEARLVNLRNKHRSSVIAATEERSKGLRVWRDSQNLASKLYSFKHDPGSVLKGTSPTGHDDTPKYGEISLLESNSPDLFSADIDLGPDLQEQVTWLKVELCRLLEDKRSAILRAEELETALMEMVKQDNRRQLCARVEALELEVAELRQALADKQEQERAMLQVLMRVEEEQKVTEDARRHAEEDATSQRLTAQALQVPSLVLLSFHTL
ncbi:hypothetical protein IFM89_024225 [Coptis chinensis]|uniref:Uncharacterized protein n=1 Tax=Coptis chinensis TaxID=261450 RepID=A0A835LNB7_9MAGN|nr:hypothetical protein IFM89_024225 [Coptis chinensis]